MRLYRPIGLQSIAKEPETLAPSDPQILDRSIGGFLRQVRNLSDAQIAEIVAHQRIHGIRFGEAAIELRLASSEDVLWALSQQFEYPYARDDGASFNPELIAAVDPFGAHTETIRGIRSQLMIGVMAPDEVNRPLAVVSTNVGDGKSMFAANLAVTFSQLGASTLLVDADMRTPRQHQLFGVPNNVGLSSILSGRAEATVIHRVPDLPNLFVLPVGTLPPNPVELLQRNSFGVLMRELLTKFDHIIVDTPAATHGSDALLLAAKCGLSMVIARRNTSRMKALNSFVSTLMSGPGKFAGVLINDH